MFSKCFDQSSDMFLLGGVDKLRHILVDGWNALHAHPKLARKLCSGRAEAAQSELSAMLESVHDWYCVRITVVYDGVGDDISIVRRGESLTFSEVYTPSFMTADEFIEQFCAASKRPQELLVVSRDNLLRLTASSFGVSSLSPESFFERASETEEAVRKRAALNKAASDAEWSKENPFSKLDELASDIESAFKNPPLVSKRLRKKMRKSGGKGGADGKGGAHCSKKITGMGDGGKLKDGSQSNTKILIGGKPASGKAIAELKKILEFRTDVRSERIRNK